MNEKPEPWTATFQCRLKKGFTQIPNKVITEIFIKGLLSQTEMRIALYIIRQSIGYHRDWTNERTVQKMADDIGMSRRLCSTTINQMIKENKLLRSEGKFKFCDAHNAWLKVLTNPDNKCPQNLTESVNKKEQSVLTNRNTREPDNDSQITVLENPKYIFKYINKEERNIKERKIFFNKTTFKFENIPKEKLEKWKEAFPLINVEVELKKMEAWLTANPKNKKVNYERFIVNWLDRAKGEKANGKYIALSYKDTGRDNREKQEGNGKPIPPGEW